MNVGFANSVAIVFCLLRYVCLLCCLLFDLLDWLFTAVVVAYCYDLCGCVRVCCWLFVFGCMFCCLVVCVALLIVLIV